MHVSIDHTSNYNILWLTFIAAAFDQQLEFQEVDNSSDSAVLNKEEPRNIGVNEAKCVFHVLVYLHVATSILDGPVQPQCYNIEENPAYSTTRSERRGK